MKNNWWMGGIREQEGWWLKYMRRNLKRRYKHFNNRITGKVTVKRAEEIMSRNQLRSAQIRAIETEQCRRFVDGEL